MNDEQILESLKVIIGTINPAAKVKENSALIGDSILDPLEFMNYLTKVEELFKVTITDSEISVKQLGIVANMVTYISSKNQSQN